MKNKKTLVIIGVVVVIVLILSAIGGSSDSNTDITSTTTTNYSNTSSTTTTKKSTQSEDISIPETVWVDYNGFKVTVKSIKKNYSDYTLKINLENNSTNNLSISLDHLIINDCVISAWFYEDVAPGKKANSEISIDIDKLKDANINIISKIELFAHISNPDTYLKLEDCAPITINTSAFDKMEERDDSGEVLFDNGEFRIINKGIKKNWIGSDCVMLYIENNSKKSIGTTLEYVAVNGYMLTSLLSYEIPTGKYMVAELEIYSSMLEENDITDIEEVAFEISFYDHNTYKTIAKTGELIVK